MFRIAIVGAGPAGLSVASILKRSAIASRVNISVFERDSRDRDQGAGWDVDSRARKTLLRAGVDISKISRASSDTLRIFKIDQLDEPMLMIALPRLFSWMIKPNLETNRHAMRDSLLEQLERPPSDCNIRFNCPAVDIVETDSKGEAELLGQDRQSLGRFDLVIDASGVNSSLRSKRVVEEADRSQHYVGLMLVHGIISSPEKVLDKRLVRALGEGSTVFFGPAPQQGTRNIYLQRFGAKPEDKRTTLGSLVAREHIGDLSRELDLPPSSRFISDEDDPEKLNRVKTFLKEEHRDWPAEFHHCIDCIESVALRPLICFPSKPPFINDNLPLICIGDALHALPPYTGEGGNLALSDAGDLATYLETILQKKLEKTPAFLAGIRKVEQSFLDRTSSTNDAGKVTRDGIIWLWKTFDFKNMSLDAVCQGPSQTWSLMSRFCSAGFKLLNFFNKREGWRMNNLK